LAAVGLNPLSDRLNTVDRWDKRLSAAAVDCAGPTCGASFDEAITVLDESSELALHRLVRERRPEATIVAASHEEKLRKSTTGHQDRTGASILSGPPVEVHAYADRIVIRQDGRVVAEHSRSFGRGDTTYDPWHYVPVLARKPGLELMGPDLWMLVRDGKGSVATHATFAAAVKHSPLLGDFLGIVVAEQYRRFGKAISNTMFGDYLEGCRERDPQMPMWTEATRLRIRSSVFQMLAQAGYLENTRTLKLQPVHIADQVIQYLEANREEYVLRCLQVSP
jgi:hypothetical protein